MSEIMRPVPFDKIMNWALSELKKRGSIFGIHKEKFYRNDSGKHISIFDETITSPVGPAAGPNSQLAQNILSAYLAGSRFIELKTVQKMDGAELRACVPRPCINAEDECYNVEWSTELTVQEAFDEYVKAWFAIQVLAKELGISEQKDFAYNMSVGYDLDGIKSEKIDHYIEGMKNASSTAVWKECITWLRENISRFQKFTASDIDGFSTQICSSITLSTLHGCPPAEIERIAKYLLNEKKVHTYVKCNPTLLGYRFARDLLDSMGYGYLSFTDHHFNNDLQYNDAIEMFRRLMDFAAERNLAFGVKITNTFPVQIKRKELPGEEMYMSGRSLYPLSLSVAAKLSKDFAGKLPISYSGGADVFNIESLLRIGIRPITVATTILKPGGYERLHQLAQLLEPLLTPEWNGIDAAALEKLATNVAQNQNHRKEKRETGSRKTDVPLALFDCFQAPCKDGGCPIHQQIPQYLKLVAEGDYQNAFRIIAIDNAAPSITGTICNHACQQECTRVDYDSALQIRTSKLIAANACQQAYIEQITPANVCVKRRAVVIGAGPAGIAAALYLRRNGVATTVLEKRDRPFGIVEYVIPSFRIAADAIKRDYEMAKAHGVEFQFGVKDEIDIAALKKEYDFVILAIGAWKEGASPVKEGQEYTRDALEFLLKSKEKDCQLDIGKRVAVIGGGDVAMDCARAAKRAPGVEEVTIVYRRTVDFMPAEAEEIHLAKEDGIKFMELLGPVSYKDNILTCEKMTLSDWDESGRRSVKSTGESVTLSFDTVINAVGARVDTSLFEKNSIALNNNNKVRVNASCETSLENVYIAGDCKAGPSTIVAAMADAKTIAIDILDKLELANDFIRINEALPADTLIARKGILEAAHFDHTDGNRCLGCDTICEICCDVCPNRANVSIPVPGLINAQQILHVDGMCNECGNCGVFCPHSGNPYKDKWTIFWTEEDFLDSENRGFLKQAENQYKLRLENGTVLECALNDQQVPAAVRSFIQVIEKDFSHLM